MILVMSAHLLPRKRLSPPPYPAVFNLGLDCSSGGFYAYQVMESLPMAHRWRERGQGRDLGR